MSTERSLAVDLGVNGRDTLPCLLHAPVAAQKASRTGSSAATSVSSHTTKSCGTTLVAPTLEQPDCPL